MGMQTLYSVNTTPPNFRSRNVKLLKTIATTNTIIKALFLSIVFQLILIIYCSSFLRCFVINLNSLKIHSYIPIYKRMRYKPKACISK